MPGTRVAVIGAGPSGLLLARLLERSGIRTTVLESRSRGYVEARIRAGILEPGTVELLRDADVAWRVDRDGVRHDGFKLAFADRVERIDLAGLTGRQVTVYGQTEIQKDLGDAHEAAGTSIHYSVSDVRLGNLTGSAARISYTEESGVLRQFECDFVAGCDGSHGVCRPSIPADRLQRFDRTYPFGWLGMLTDVPPLGDELVYANHPRGFALCSMRSPTRSRYYLQCGLQDRVADWPDERFWDELRRRIPDTLAARLITGPSIEKSIAPLRSSITEPMQYGRLFLVGDAAHIVPPTGAKGLNLAMADVRMLHQALAEFNARGNDTLIREYSARALTRVWKAARFSWWFTTLMHKLSDEAFDYRMQLAELDYLSGSASAAHAMAENYVGLPW